MASSSAQTPARISVLEKDKRAAGALSLLPSGVAAISETHRPAERRKDSACVWAFLTVDQVGQSLLWVGRSLGVYVDFREQMGG